MDGWMGMDGDGYIDREIETDRERKRETEREREKATDATRQRDSETQQPFGPSMHQTTDLSCRFPIFETSATALRYYWKYMHTSSRQQNGEGNVG